MQACAKGGFENGFYSTRPPDLTFLAVPKTLGSFAHLRFVNGDLCFFFCLVYFLLAEETHFLRKHFLLCAFWLVFRPPPVLSDGGNKAFPPESSARWRGNGLHSNELFLQASFGSLFLYPLARRTNSKQKPYPWASKIHRNSADLTVRGSL